MLGNQLQKLLLPHLVQTQAIHATVDAQFPHCPLSIRFEKGLEVLLVVDRGGPQVVDVPAVGGDVCVLLDELLLEGE